MTHHVVGIQTLLFIPLRHYGSNSISVMGGAITRSPVLQHPGLLSRRSAQTAEGRQGWLHQVLCVTESLSDSVQFFKKPLIKTFNRRLNHIIQSVCFLFQISCIAIRPAGLSLRFYTRNHTHTRTHQPHIHKISFISLYFFSLLFYTPSFLRVFSFSLTPQLPSLQPLHWV